MKNRESSGGGKPSSSAIQVGGAASHAYQCSPRCGVAKWNSKKAAKSAESNNNNDNHDNNDNSNDYYDGGNKDDETKMILPACVWCSQPTWSLDTYHPRASNEKLPPSWPCLQLDGYRMSPAAIDDLLEILPTYVILCSLLHDPPSTVCAATFAPPYVIRTPRLHAWRLMAILAHRITPGEHGNITVLNLYLGSSTPVCNNGSELLMSGVFYAIPSVSERHTIAGRLGVASCAIDIKPSQTGKDHSRNSNLQSGG
ncbi:hypothetical protein BX600DRAFT_429211 [Xylariales sp. PMI_506]|nr:hypothetical protein BX600DRAFT_429211 [Xylariales sp. PMI_506]